MLPPCLPHEGLGFNVSENKAFLPERTLFRVLFYPSNGKNEEWTVDSAGLDWKSHLLDSQIQILSSPLAQTILETVPSDKVTVP